MAQEQNNQQPIIINQPEQQGISLFEFFGVLFGRKLLLLIVTVALFVTSGAAILVYNNSKSTYEGMYDYYVSGLADGKYIDGSRFDVRDLITLDKLQQYKEEHEELSKLNMEDVYYKGVIESLKFEVTYKKNETKMNDEDNEYVIDKAGYKIVLTKKALSLKQAQVLTKAIAEEANVISQQIVDNADYTQYLTLYKQSNNYDQQIEYLSAQYTTIYNKYTNLIEQYGDVVVKDGQKLSDIQLQMQEYFQNISFDSLKQELNYNGYVKTYEEYEIQIAKQIEALNREKAVAQQKKDELINQREQLVNAAAAGQLQTLELTAYNEQIIALTNRIFDIEEEVKLLQLKLDNKGKAETDDAYKLDMQLFESKLLSHYNKLDEMTKNYTNLEKDVVKKYSLVYFDSNKIVEKKNGIKLIAWLAVAGVSSLAIAMIVNLCLDGKKLTKKYKDEHKNS